ncbi:hypothetical protein D3C84_478700 [compost metagenome]
MVELVDQGGLVHAHELGVGTDVAAGEGVPGQLVEVAGLELAQRQFGQVEVTGDLAQGESLALTGLTQGLARVGASRRCSFWMRRFHHCSDRYC